MAQAPTFMSGLTNFFGGNQQQQGHQQNDPQLDDDFVEEEKVPGVGDLIGDIFTPPDPEEDDEQDSNLGPQLGPDGKPLPTPQQKLAATIQEAIGKMTITEDMLPKDFDPSNPQHLRELLGKSQQQTALTTIQLAFQPMQMAMEEMMTTFTKKLDDKLNGFGNQQSESAILKGLVPEAEDPQYSGLVQTLFTQAKKSKAGNGDAKAAAQMVRKGLDAMGIKTQKQADPFTGSGFKSGAAALDSYAPLPQRKPQQRQNNGGGQ